LSAEPAGTLLASYPRTTIQCADPKIIATGPTLQWRIVQQILRETRSSFASAKSTKEFVVVRVLLVVLDGRVFVDGHSALPRRRLGTSLSGIPERNGLSRHAPVLVDGEHSQFGAPRRVGTEGELPLVHQNLAAGAEDLEPERSTERVTRIE
jgi:hypothetical protein